MGYLKKNIYLLICTYLCYVIIDKEKFLDHLFDLHNMSRKIIRVQPVLRNYLVSNFISF